MYIKRREAPAKERGQLLWRNTLQAARVRAGRRPMAAALLGIMLLLCLSASPRAEIWPLPRHMSCVAGSGPVHPGLLAPSISVALTGPGAGSSVAALAAARYQLSLRAAAAVGGEILRVDVAVAAADDALDARTNYTYELSRQPGSTITGTAASPFAVAYALESVLQLSADTQQRRRCATFSLSDSPRFAHRGLLVDTGRRFYPVPMLEALLDAMAAVKLNVLHLYLSEECFRVESKRFPQLTASNCTVEPNFHYSSPGYYTQQQVRSLVLFARLRGIRLLPEIDLPAHSAGICAGLRNAGIVCCGKGGKYGFGQILDDQHGQSVALVQQLLAEISELFPESLFHVGADETGSTPPCTHDNTRNFERKILRFVSTQLDKTPVVWEEALFESGAVNLTLPHKVIIDTWQTAGWQQAAVAGYNVVASREPRLYLDYPEHSAAAMWYDLLNGSSNPKLVSRLLGAEVSMWSDRYVPRGPASCLYQAPERDADFANSTSSTIWPRAAVAAGSFWHYDATLDAGSARFASMLRSVGARVARTGTAVCACSTPQRNGCWQSEWCGERWCNVR